MQPRYNLLDKSCMHSIEMALLNAVALSTSSFASVSPLRYKSIENLQFMKVSVTNFHSKPLLRTPVIRCSLDDKIINIEPPADTADFKLSRSDFPKDFLFGASSSALQTEGINGGRGPSTWDWMLTDFGATDAIDSYHRFKDDVKMLKGMSANCYRFSISWSRVLPKGTLAGGINYDAIRFYNSFIDELISNGITPIITLLHYDLPQALMDDYQGFLDKQFVSDFTDYAGLCFSNFGDRVKMWTTFNEPQIISGQSVYCGNFEDRKTTMPYICAHHIILAHASAYKLYQETYKDSQGGEIGFPTCVMWFLPYNDSPADIDAASRARDFYLGWYLEPLVTGDYPFSMKAIVEERLPTFTDEEKEMVKGSFDFITINYYTSRYAEAVPINAKDLPISYEKDQYVIQHQEDKDGNPIGELAPGDNNANQCPKLLKDILLDLKNHYGNPKTYISENGVMEKRDDSLDISEQLADDHRIKYLAKHLQSVRDAMNEGANVKGYCMWCLNDSVELAAGYTVRMGLNYIDYLNEFERIPKKSAGWYNEFLSQPQTDPQTPETGPAPLN